MSDLSVALHDVVNFFDDIVHKVPAGDTSVANAGTALANAEQAVLAAVPALVDTAVNAALNLVPGGGVFSDVTDTFLNQLITKLEAKKSTAASAAPAA